MAGKGHTAGDGGRRTPDPLDRYGGEVWFSGGDGFWWRCRFCGREGQAYVVTSAWHGLKSHVRDQHVTCPWGQETSD